jgi:hypothetical protein
MGDCGKLPLRSGFEQSPPRLPKSSNQKEIVIETEGVMLSSRIGGELAREEMSLQWVGLRKQSTDFSTG